MMNNIFDKRRLKTFSNCKELVKSMVGTRDGVIVYNNKFRLDLENTCYKASMCEDLQQRIDKAIEYIENKKELNKMFGTITLSKDSQDELLEILGGKK